METPIFFGSFDPSNWIGNYWGIPINYWPSFYCAVPDLPESSGMMNYFEREFEKFKRNAARNNRVYSTELCSFPSRPTSLLEHYSFMNPIRFDAEGNRWLNCCFDLRSFKPEEIQVIFDTKERCIHVEASHEVKDVKEHYVRRHYNRKFFIPEELEIDLKKLKPNSYLTNEGLLYVEAAIPKMSHEETRMPPVQHPHGSRFAFTPIKAYPVEVKRV